MTQPSSNATALVTPDGVQCRGQVVLSKTWLPNDELRILRQQLDDAASSTLRLAIRSTPSGLQKRIHAFRTCGLMRQKITNSSSAMQSL